MNATSLQDVLKAIEVHGLPAPPGGVRPGPDDMLTMTELAARLKQAMRTVERWHRKGVVLGIKVDGVVMFYWPAVVARLVEKYQERDGAEGGSQKADVRSTASQPAALTQPAAPVPISKAPSSVLRTPSPQSGDGKQRTNVTNGTGVTPRPGPIPVPKAPSVGLRAPIAVPTGTARSAVATTKRPK